MTQDLRQRLTGLRDELAEALREANCTATHMRAKNWHAKLDAILAAIPEGWVVMPMEPTKEMLKSAFPYHYNQSPAADFVAHWNLALSAIAPPDRAGDAERKAGFVDVVKVGAHPKGCRCTGCNPKCRAAYCVEPSAQADDSVGAL